MTSKKFLALATAIFALFALTGVAMAANRVEVKVTSEPISQGAVCDMAGGFSLQFDGDTVLEAGDQITIDMPVGANGKSVSICKDIDEEISLGSEAPYPNGTSIPNATGTSAQYPVYFTTTGTPGTAVTGSVYFTLKGTAGQQTITLTVMGAAPTDNIKVGTDDTLTIHFLDQSTNSDFTGAGAFGGIWIQGTTAGVYDTAAAKGDNTLCINVSDWDQSTVDAHMNSSDTTGSPIYTFIPSNPEIAHLALAATYAFATCTKSGTLNEDTACGVKASSSQDTDNCHYFDYETRSGYRNTVTSTAARIIISTSQTNFPLSDYQIKLEILVNGVTGDHGFYWSNQSVRADGFSSLDDACNTTPSSMPFAGAQANYKYYNGAGSALSAADIELPHTGGKDSCTVADNASATTVLTNAASASSIGISSGKDYLMIDLPAVNYDLAKVTTGDKVSVRVTLIKAPCGQIFQDTREIASYCYTTTEINPVYSLLYPYYTALAAGDNWWDGFVVDNLGDTDGKYTAIIYEQDGDVGVFTGTVGAHSLDQSTLAQKLAGATLVKTGTGPGAGTLGDSLCYIVVCTDFPSDGFAFMGSTMTNINSYVSHESMGYLPRLSHDNSGTNNATNLCTSIMGSTLPGEIPSF